MTRPWVEGAIPSVPEMGAWLKTCTDEDREQYAKGYQDGCKDSLASFERALERDPDPEATQRLHGRR